MAHTKSTNRFYPILGYSGYFISKETSQVLCTNEDFPVILTQTPASKGKDNYYLVQLNDQKNHYIHRLMANTFLTGETKEHVNHIDGNKQNNSIINLEWATPKENAQHAVDLNLSVEFGQKIVHQYTLSGNFITSFESGSAAEKATGVAKENINNTAAGRKPHAGGYQWSRELKQTIEAISANIVKEFIITNITTTKSFQIVPKGQSTTSMVAYRLGIAKHVLERRFSKEGNLIYINDYRIERVFFE